MSVIFKSDGIEFRLTFWGYASTSAKRPSPAAAAPVLRSERRPIAFSFVDIYSPFRHQNLLACGTGPFSHHIRYPKLNLEADARPPRGSILPVQLRRPGQGEARGARPPHHAVLSRGQAERWPAAGWGGGRQSGERDPQAVRSARATVPSGASADRDSCVAGTRLVAQSATGADSGRNASGADERRNCDERIVFR